MLKNIKNMFVSYDVAKQNIAFKKIKDDIKNYCVHHRHINDLQQNTNDENIYCDKLIDVLGHIPTNISFNVNDDVVVVKMEKIYNEYRITACRFNDDNKIYYSYALSSHISTYHMNFQHINIHAQTSLLTHHLNYISMFSYYLFNGKIHMVHDIFNLSIKKNAFSSFEQNMAIELLLKYKYEFNNDDLSRLICDKSHLSNIYMNLYMTKTYDIYVLYNIYPTLSSSEKYHVLCEMMIANKVIFNKDTIDISIKKMKLYLMYKKINTILLKAKFRLNNIHSYHNDYVFQNIYITGNVFNLFWWITDNIMKNNGINKKIWINNMYVLKTINYDNDIGDGCIESFILACKTLNILYIVDDVCDVIYDNYVMDKDAHNSNVIYNNFVNNDTYNIIDDGFDDNFSLDI
jgi:hypothetical protein